MGEQVLVDVDELKLALRRLQDVLRIDEERARFGEIGHGSIARRVSGVDQPQRESVSITAVRQLATAAGVDPWSVTDRFAGIHYPHAYDDDEGRGYWDCMGSRGCRKCIFPGSWHDPAGEKPPSVALAPPPKIPEPPPRHADGAFVIPPRTNTPGIPVLGGGFTQPLGDSTGDQESLPAHLRDDAPRQQCNSCGRFTVATGEFGAPCNMPQPSGQRCTGIFHGEPRIATSETEQ
jgi:hypothetical protein